MNLSFMFFCLFILLAAAVDQETIEVIWTPYSEPYCVRTVTQETRTFDNPRPGKLPVLISLAPWGACYDLAQMTFAVNDIPVRDSAVPVSVSGCGGPFDGYGRVTGAGTFDLKDTGNVLAISSTANLPCFAGVRVTLVYSEKSKAFVTL
jgi:hypothetical protein